MIELDHCPFCGKSATISYGNDNEGLYVNARCNSCGCRTPNFYYSFNHVTSELHEAEMMATKRWNRRVNDNV